jgi:hypothetical protein
MAAELHRSLVPANVLKKSYRIYDVEATLALEKNRRILCGDRCTNKTSSAIDITSPVTCYSLIPTLVGSPQRSSSFWLVTEYLEWDSYAGHLNNVCFPITCLVLYEFHD